jgi:hypothetical protein
MKKLTYLPLHFLNIRPSAPLPVVLMSSFKRVVPILASTSQFTDLSQHFLLPSA